MPLEVMHRPPTGSVVWLADVTAYELRPQSGEGREAPEQALDVASQALERGYDRLAPHRRRLTKSYLVHELRSGPEPAWGIAPEQLHAGPDRHPFLGYR